MKTETANTKLSKRGVGRLAGARRLLLVLTVIVNLTLPVLAMPMQPHQFYGSVSIGSTPAPEGTVVSARIGGIEYVSTTVDAQGRYGWDPVFKVPADDPDTQGKEGGVAGEIVEFYVGGVLGGQYEFEIWGITELNLIVPPATVELTVVADPAERGTVTGSGTCSYGVYAPITATAADECWYFTGWTGTGITDPTSASTTVYMDDDKTVTAHFAKHSYTIMATAGAGGAISPGGAQVVECGDGKTFTIIADSGYVIQNVLVDGMPVGSVRSYTFDDVRANHTIHASFAGTAEFMVPLYGGWNLLSTPIKLEAGSNTLAEIFTPQSVANIELFLRWDTQNGRWVSIYGDFVLTPLEAIYVKVKPGASATATFVPSEGLSTPPSRGLIEGANLIGPAPAFEGGGFPTTSLIQALVSIEEAPGGLRGYTMVVSPGVNQPSWVYALGGQSRDLLPYKGYWVVMENADTLWGFSTTPITP